MNDKDKYAAKFGTSVARTTTTFSGPIVNPLQQQVNQQPQKTGGATQKLGSVGQAVDFISKFSRQVGSVAIGAAKLGTNYAKNLAETVYKDVTGTADTLTGIFGGGYRVQQELINQRQKALDNARNNVNRAFSTGKMNLTDYKKRMEELHTLDGELKRDIDEQVHNLSAGRKAKEIVGTATLLFMPSKLTPAFKAGVETGNSTVLTALAASGMGKNASVFVKSIAAASKKAEEAVAKIPSLGKLLERRAGEEAGETTLEEALKSGAKNTLLNFFIKKPLIIDASIEEVRQIVEAVDEGNFKGALGRTAFLATMALEGGPVGAAIRGMGKFGGTTRSLVFGRGSFIDTLSRNVGDGNPQGIYKYMDNLRTTDSDKFDQVNNAMKALQEMNLRKASEDVNVAVDFVKDHYIGRGINLESLSHEQLVKDMLKYYENFKKVNTYAKQGLIDGIAPHEWRKIAIGTFDTQAKNNLVQMLRATGTDKGAQLAIIAKMSSDGVQWTQNRLIFNKIQKLIQQSTDTDQLAKEIRGITTATELKGVPAKLAKELSKDGYFVIRPQKNLAPFVEGEQARGIVSAFAPRGDAFFEQSVKPFPIAMTAGSALRRLGISPEDTSMAVYYRLTDNLSHNLQDLKLSKKLTTVGDFSTDAQVIMRRLQDVAESKRSAYDIRQLRLDEIAQALDVTRKDAKLIRNAVMQSYLDMPLQLRGFGDKIMDYNLRFNPLAPGYSRIQSAARYAYNPFFRWQEITETELLAQLTSGGKKPAYLGLNKLNQLIFRTSAEKLDDTVRKMDDARIFTTGFSGEGAANAVTFGRVTANITKTQKRSIAGLVQKMAQRQNMTVDQMLTENYEQVVDAARVIVQYPQRGALNSPLARTINVMFFPARYNIKVAGLVAKQLATLPPALQLATINSMFDFKDWLSSEEGIVWQSDHKEAIQLFKWLTPVGSLEWASRVLGGNVNSVGELGLLGGLPFGFISQMLDSQGVVQMNTPYVDMSNGDVIPKYVPDSLKARANMALVDLLGSLFTYPGRTIGLPGKGEFLRNTAKGLTGGESGEFKVQDQEGRLTETQRRQVEVIRNENLGEMNVKKEPPVLPGQFMGYSLPMMLPPVERKKEVKEPNAPELRAMKKSRKRKPAGERTARPLEKR
jgi:hypothetical protein